MEKTTVNWAVIAPGRIAQKFAAALGALEQAGEPVCRYAAASRTAEKAAAFARQWGFRKSYGSYDELLADPDVDAVYIAAPHPFHAALSIQALKAGKHVVSEKPAAVNAELLQSVIDCAREQHKFYMEAMWTAFNPSVRAALAWTQSGKIGAAVHVDAKFCFRSAYDPDDRLFNPALGGGALLDVGVYTLTFAMKVAKAVQDAKSGKPAILCAGSGTVAEPRRIVSTARIEKGADRWNNVELSFASGMDASLQSAVDMAPAADADDAYIYGTKGYIAVPHFWKAESAALFTYTGPGGSDATLAEKAENKFFCNGYEYEIREATSCMLAGKTETQLHSPADALAVCKVMDAIRAQWHLVYPFEMTEGQLFPQPPAHEAAPSSELVIYTDGGCSGNPGAGGWACVIIDGAEEHPISGGELSTTNNRMELMAAISALSAAAQNAAWKAKKIKVFSDSQYVRNGITSWISGWKKNGWLTSAKKPVLNRDLWEELDALYSALDVEWAWVKGHAGVKYNEMCDALCQKEIRAQQQ